MHTPTTTTHRQVFALACLRLLAHANARLLSQTDIASHLLPLLGSDDRDVQRAACDVLEQMLTVQRVDDILHRSIVLAGLSGPSLGP